MEQPIVWKVSPVEPVWTPTHERVQRRLENTGPGVGSEDAALLTDRLVGRMIRRPVLHPKLAEKLDRLNRAAQFRVELGTATAYTEPAPSLAIVSAGTPRSPRAPNTAPASAHPAGVAA